MMAHARAQPPTNHLWQWMLRLGVLAAFALMACLARPVVATETVTLYVVNVQGSVVATMTPQGAVTYTAAYRPYGQKAQGTAQAGPGYAGHVMDPTSGLVYMQQRYYDPSIGRFLSPDPVGPTPGNIFNFGRYTYANNNPVRFTDPTGRCAEYYSKDEGGGCKVDMDPSIANNKKAQAARKAVENTLNKYDKAINALSDSKTYVVVTKNPNHKTESLVSSQVSRSSRYGTGIISR